jgi:AAA15 family ATPase/GTPase
MFKSIWIDNFKSLVDFELNFAKFNCLVGLNGSGKSTVLQALDFVSQLMQGDLDGWLNSRHWENTDLNSKLSKKSNIDFKIIFEIKSWGEVIWSGSFNRKTLSCTQERVERDGILLLKVEDGYCFMTHSFVQNSSSDRFPIMFDYQGSILSQLKETQVVNPVLRDIKVFVLRIESLDMLSPELLRSRTKSADGKLGLGGEKLSAFIHESGNQGKEKLKRLLTKIYGQLENIDTRSLRSGWKQLEITEQFGGHKFKSTARHVNDGMLRLMAILTQLESDNDFLLFDEIENGINPEVIEYLIDHLVNAYHQVLVTTHSPMILNYLEDDVAKKGVIYLYKNSQGMTRSVKLFDIPSMAKKLQFMGPGEAFADTDLTNLYQEIDNLPQEIL